MRGWLVPGFWPVTTITCAFSKSSSVTVPLPMPIVSDSPQPLDSWHMFEQSGRLLVPNCADEELVEEGRFVAGAADGVERRLVGRASAFSSRATSAKASSQEIGR